MAIKTRKGSIYTLRVEDLKGFPSDCSEIYVTKMLCDRDGNELSEENFGLHVLSSDYGYTHISHYELACWNPNISICKLYLIGGLLLNAYELYLEKGEIMIALRDNYQQCCE